jgi:hypothetical protein
VERVGGVARRAPVEIEAHIAAGEGGCAAQVGVGKIVAVESGVEIAATFGSVKLGGENEEKTQEQRRGQRAHDLAGIVSHGGPGSA